MLERFVNEDMINPSAEAKGKSAAAALSPLNALAQLFTAKLTPIQEMEAAATSSQSNLLSQYQTYINSLEGQIKGSGQPQNSQFDQDQNELKSQLLNMKAPAEGISRVMADFIAAAQNEKNQINRFFESESVPHMLGFEETEEAQLALKERALISGNTQLAALLEDSNQGKANLLTDSYNTMSVEFPDHDMILENPNSGINNAAVRRRKTYPEVFSSLISFIAIHEFGHVLGMGHQFKENILPEPGTVPEKYLAPLRKRATEENEFTNITSVMGYPNGRVRSMIPAEEIVPAPHDALVLRYLYKGEYAAFKPNDADFTYIPVPVSGRIPEYTDVSSKAGRSGRIKTTYFPRCNDIEATYGLDPFCNRQDRGNTAVEIVNSYFDSISDHMLYSLFSLIGGRGNAEENEMRMWTYAFAKFSRIRLFYDEMRRRMRTDEDLKPFWDRIRSSKKDLFEFSTACQLADPTGPDVKSEDLRKLFANKSIVDLCRANALALNEFNFFLNLPDSDFTRIDHNNRYYSNSFSGDAVAKAGNLFGSWYQMTNFPLKYVAMYSLTTANPFVMTDWGGVIPNPFYDNSENRYLYRTLYPVEVTKRISTTVQNNLRFTANGRDSRTSMGRIVLALGSLLRNSRFQTNDSERLPRNFNDLLDQQTQFKMSSVAIFISALDQNVSGDAADGAPADASGDAAASTDAPAASPAAGDTSDVANAKDDADRYKKFTASIFDFTTNKSETAREVYLLPNGDVLVWANDMFLYPITKLKFHTAKGAYVFAYKVSYDNGVLDEVKQYSLKYALLDKHEEIINTCIAGVSTSGKSNGLASYFNSSNPSFRGFKILSGIESEKGTDKLTRFYQSLQEEFDTYEKANNPKIPSYYPIKSMSGTCDEVIRGIGQIAAAAALINGNWMSITQDYFQK